MAADNTSKLLADTAAKAPMLAFLTYTIDNDPPQYGGGQALCINATDGIFMTYAVEGWMKTKNLKDASLRLSDGKSVKANLMWVDPETGLGFFRATEKGNFIAANFQKDPKLAVGQQVTSLGLLEETTHTPYVAGAYVSAVLKSPDPIVLVTGGHLTCEGSPVFDESGQVVGMVSSQPFERFVTPTQQGGQQDLLLKGRQVTSFFSPASNLATILDYMAKTPDTPRLMPWIGALFDLLPSTDSRFGEYKTPVLRVGTVIPGQNGDKAGLQTDDLVIAVNGKPFEKQAGNMVVRDFQRQLLQSGVNSDISLTVRHPRQKEDSQVKLHLEPLPPQAQEAARYVVQSMGFIARELMMLDQYNESIPAAKNGAKGVLVIYVPQQGPAYVAGLENNDLIIAVNDQNVTSISDFKKTVEDLVKANPEKEIKLVIRRGKDAETQPITIKPAAQPTSAPAK
jgi:S1-C subfamily serine protease